MSKTINAFELLSVKISILTKEELFSILESYVTNYQRSKTNLIGYVNLHGLYVSKNDYEMLNFYFQSDLNYIDGMPIIWLGKILGERLSFVNRITLLDYLYEMLEFSTSKGFKIAWVGGTEESISKGIQTIRSKVDNIDILGINGYKDDQYYINQLNNFKPDIVLVGLGMPAQEKWTMRLKDQLNAKVIWNIGATIDFVSKKVPKSPSWAGKYGFDWFFRFINEPRRMFFRYFIEPIFLVFYFLKQWR